jgi:ubiquitin-protein ligase
MVRPPQPELIVVQPAMPEPATEELLGENLRITKDVTELKDRFSVEALNETMTEICVDFLGPANSPYEGSLWKVQVSLPCEYPNKPPQLCFKNNIFHPNIHESNGTLCELSSFANQNLIWIFDSFLPQLLRNPDLSNPINTEAAGMLVRSPKLYFDRVREVNQMFAKIGFKSETCSYDPSVILVESVPIPCKRNPITQIITKLSNFNISRCIEQLTLHFDTFPKFKALADQVGVRTGQIALSVIGVVFFFVLIGLGADFFTNFVGVIYPAYMSFKALESVNHKDDKQWLCYWVVFGAFTTADQVTNSLLFWVPFYKPIKLLVLLFLAWPETHAAEMVYDKFLHPFLKKHEAKIDEAPSLSESKVQEAKSGAMQLRKDHQQSRQPEKSKPEVEALDKSQFLMCESQVEAKRVISFIGSLDEETKAEISSNPISRSEILDAHERHNQLMLSNPDKPLQEFQMIEDYGIPHMSNLISREYLDPGYDKDFTNIDDQGQVQTRGGLPYHRPCGWMRIALKVNGCYENDIWMGCSGADGEWAVSYHGSDFESCKNIATMKYQLAKCRRGSPYGIGIYSVPRIETAVQYSRQFVYEGHNYKVVLQNRVNPRFLNIVNSGLYYVSPIQEDIRPYGLLIKRT